MRNTEQFKGKRITIVGLARSGLACAQLLSELGAEISVTDSQDNATTRANLARLKARDIRAELGKHTRAFIQGRDLIVISPGVDSTSLPVVWAEEISIPVVSEIEVGWQLCPAPIIAVTGTSGKTTVTTLTGRVIEAHGRKAFVCGNIGNPFCGEVSQVRPEDFVSLEISSFQLERIRTFKPKVAVILNISRNHLDRYRDMQEYSDAKKRIFMNQGGSEFLVLNARDQGCAALAAGARSQIVYFSQTEDFNPNQAAVMRVAEILGIRRDTCMRVFGEFRGLEHRMEEVAEINNIRFINDSKATTADSALWALERISCPVILIAGGKHKGIDYRVILDAARAKVKEVILIGEAKEIMRRAFDGILRLDEADSLEGAVKKAYALAQPGDCILLSPMCSSFDMFSNYEERGRVFKEAVLALAAASAPR